MIRDRFKILLLLVGFTFLTTCREVKEVMMVSTGDVTSIQTNSAEASGMVIDLGGGATEHGHCYAKTPNVSINNLKTALGNPAVGGFTSILSDLEAGTKYYIKAYLSNGKETVYGKEISFSTSAALLPEITTKPVTDITQQGAISGGNISSDGGAPVTARGVCWNTSSGPIISNFKTAEGSGTGTYSSNLTGLSLSTTYYVRAYATNSTGTGYGNEVYFTTAAGAVIPPVTTTDISAITKNSAVSGGTISNDGGTPVTDRGVCWSTTINPTIASFKTSDGTGIGNYPSNLTGLNSGTTYYVRAFATNNVGTGYGNQLTFTTNPDTPTVITATISYTSGITAAGGGNIISDGGAAITARGVCWSIATNPTISNSKTTDGVGTGTFTSSISGLNPVTFYYVRAYATNSVGTAYGNDVSFTTSTAPPTLTTAMVSTITGTTASSGGNITSDGGATITARGVCWNTSPNPTESDNKTTNGSGIGSFTSSITGLNPATLYYVRSYATNSAGTAYGNEISFTTNASVPVLTTTAISSITTTAATGGGNITSDGGSSVTERGICWSTTATPTTSDNKIANGSGTGSFISSISGLTPATLYYVRAYATNNTGTAYGDQVSFTTTAFVPTLTTISITSITSSTAVSGGNITNDGGATVTSRGICWNTSPNPTVSNNVTTNGTGIGNFVSNLIELSAATLYYVRAFATNSAGTAYGNEISFTTSATLPSITTTDITLIKAYSASSGGNISSDGGVPVTARGVCWSTAQNPTISDNHSTDGTGTGSFTSNITGLSPLTKYYVRAYATNSEGTAYGSETSFTTVSDAPPTTPANIGATPGDKQVSIVWDAVSDVTSYTVYWSTNPGVSKTNYTGKITGITTIPYIHTGLTSGTSYYYVVTANNDYAESNESSEARSMPPLLLQTSTFTDTGQKHYYQVTVSSGQSLFVNVNTAFNGNDFYLYVKYGVLPTTSDFDAKSETGADEAISITNTQAGTYYIMVYASSLYGFGWSGDYTITGSTCVTALTLGSTTAKTITHNDEKHYFEVTVSSGQNLFVNVNLASTRNDFFLYAKYGSLPTISVNDARSETGESEAISFTNTQAGTYYIMVYGSSLYGFGYSGDYTIKAFQ
jgi:hypothetical protein